MSPSMTRRRSSVRPPCDRMARTPLLRTWFRRARPWWGRETWKSRGGWRSERDSDAQTLVHTRSRRCSISLLETSHVTVTVSGSGARMLSDARHVSRWRVVCVAISRCTCGRRPVTSLSPPRVMPAQCREPECDCSSSGLEHCGSDGVDMWVMGVKHDEARGL